MSAFVLPILFTLFVWWFSTGADPVPRRAAARARFRWTHGGRDGAAAGRALRPRRDARRHERRRRLLSRSRARWPWGWQEVAFLTGLRDRTAAARRCRPGSSEAQHFGQALQAILYHEFALVVLGALVLAITWNAPNAVGVLDVRVLWGMRQSAKLNLFLGVRNLPTSSCRRTCAISRAFFARRPLNLLFPVSVTAATVMAVFVWEHAMAPGATARSTWRRCTFAGTLLALAILEHWFMVLPLPANALWSWGLRSRDAAPPVGSVALAPVAGTDER